uniref:Coiled-coil domain-containing protein 201-like n=1 Tax=Geotrypetes seraphini TaxID=260995 RepID=A0A6P8PQU8_GEOSA|nr:coiled-coil domain-containing protein 201-like [Geotrypetes seraphini]XP_033786278.1 coiled-coil domain-containing protein 201-like [Geotrypetes seraphini]XP_033786279.1 coiled-coil domain-containing protein 201-like [Geotrypetes seraphini]XP_033786280.1 coiled-coil domain-containing protein 201-like [Geotrypetes seraphini]
MSDEEYSFLNVKRYSRKMSVIKHSTPLMESTDPKISSLEDLSERANQDLHEDNTKVQWPGTPYPFKRSLQDGKMYQPRIKSLSTILRIRLSTVLASEESIEESSSNEGHTTEIGAKANERNRLSKQRTGESLQREVPLQVSGIPGIQDEQEKKRKKMAKEKRLTMQRQIRRWEIRQLKNIEEATTHELVIEED